MFNTTAAWRARADEAIRGLRVAWFVVFIIVSYWAFDEARYFVEGKHVLADVIETEEFRRPDGWRERRLHRYDDDAYRRIITYAFTNEFGNRVTAKAEVDYDWRPPDDRKIMVTYRPYASRLRTSTLPSVALFFWLCSLAGLIWSISPWLNGLLDRLLRKRAYRAKNKGKLYRF
jgi:hypothetical protein